MRNARKIWLAGLLVLCAWLSGTTAQAQSGPLSTYDNPYANGIFNEVKLGILAHDVRFLGGKEHGADINGELFFNPFISDAVAAGIPAYIRWLFQPRPEFGFEVNTAGATNQYYLGLDWTWLVARDLFNPGQDGLTIGISFGPGFNDGLIRSRFSDRKSLGSNLLFRVAGEVGYQITPKYNVTAYLDHISNGGFAKYNDSINDVGVRFGYKF